MKNAGCAYLAGAGMQQLAASGQYLRMDVLESVCQELDESEGEANCIPDLSEQREWA